MCLSFHTHTQTDTQRHRHTHRDTYTQTHTHTHTHTPEDSQAYSVRHISSHCKVGCRLHSVVTDFSVSCSLRGHSQQGLSIFISSCLPGAGSFIYLFFQKKSPFHTRPGQVGRNKRISQPKNGEAFWQSGLCVWACSLYSKTCPLLLAQGSEARPSAPE